MRLNCPIAATGCCNDTCSRRQRICDIGWTTRPDLNQPEESSADNAAASTVLHSPPYRPHRGKAGHNPPTGDAKSKNTAAPARTLAARDQQQKQLDLQYGANFQGQVKV